MLVTILIGLCRCEVYYVKPTDSPPGLVCPGNPCQTLDCYIMKRDETYTLNGTVIMILLEGHHKVLEKKAIDFGSPLDSDNIHVKGNGLVDNVVVEGLETNFQYANTLCMENITAVDFCLSLSSSSGAQSDISIFNCNFTNSQIILNDVDLTIKDSTFSNCRYTAILLHSSIVTFMGHIRFFNNTGLQGGALALAGTTMRLDKNVNLQFIDNHATETGGAIFVSNFELLIHGYVPECFYQLMNFDDRDYNLHVQFVNNSATNGGDHIYGASLLSDCSAGFSNSVCRKYLPSFQIFYPSLISILDMNPYYQQFQLMHRVLVSVITPANHMYSVFNGWKTFKHIHEVPSHYL